VLEIFTGLETLESKLLLTTLITLPTSLLLAGAWCLPGRRFASHRLYVPVHFALGTASLLSVWIGGGLILWGVLGGVLSPFPPPGQALPRESLEYALYHTFHGGSPRMLLTAAIFGVQFLLLAARVIENRHSPAAFSLPLVFAAINVAFLAVLVLALPLRGVLLRPWQPSPYGYPWPSVVFTVVLIGLTYLAQWKVVPPYFLTKPEQSRSGIRRC